MLGTVNKIATNIQDIISSDKLSESEILATLHLLQYKVEEMFNDMILDISNCHPEDENDEIIDEYEKLIRYRDYTL